MTTNKVEIFEEHLLRSQRLHVQQIFEGFEFALGFETRNKYRILDESKRPVAFAVEQSKGIGHFFLCQIFGHWRPFRVLIFDEKREAVYELDFPFRWILKTLYVKDKNGNGIGYLQERFSLFRKKFDVYDKTGRVVARINSSFFRFWTFEFRMGPKKFGTIQKKWTGALAEMFTDMDNFVVSYADPNLTTEFKALMLSTCIMVDIVYFEQKKS